MDGYEYHNFIEIMDRWMDGHIVSQREVYGVIIVKEIGNNEW